MSLTTLGLSEKILKALKDRDYISATAIQKELIPAIFDGRDIVAGATTGTGKTAGFALPILDRLNRDLKNNRHHLRALIIVPTRELAKQVNETILSYGKYLSLRGVVLHGGVKMKSQIDRLNMGVDIVVATSGRLLEHIKQRNISLKSIEYLVLDEADTILDMGFRDEVIQIIQYLPSKRQNILISATLTSSVKILAKDILKRPKLVEVDKMGDFAKGVKQVVYPVTKELKMELLSFIIGSRNYKMVLVFVRKREEADYVVQELNLSGLDSLVIHGDKKSGARERALSAFREGKIRVLVATDIVARGLDIPSLDIVINYDVPHLIGDYIHRIGRTGRAGKSGLAITLLTPSEEIAFGDVERVIGKSVKRELIDGYVPKIERVKKGAKKIKETKRVNGAFGKRKKGTAVSHKKRKTTKRDVYKKNDISLARKKGR